MPPVNSGPASQGGEHTCPKPPNDCVNPSLVGQLAGRSAIVESGEQVQSAKFSVMPRNADQGLRPLKVSGSHAKTMALKSIGNAD
jgi:hypothetical protein